MLIQRMRDGSEGILAKIIIGLIIIVFALFGFGSITTFLAPVPKVATVNGEDVSQADMEIAVERSRRILMANNIAPENINEDELRADALERLVARELMSQAADEMDLYYGDEAIDAEIVNQEVFQIDGVFSADQFQIVLRSVGYTPVSYREEVRTDKRLGQIVTGIEGSAFLTDPEAERFSSLFSQKRDLAYLQIQVGDLVTEVEVTDDDIQRYYAETPEAFMTEETVVLEFVELKREDLTGEVEVDDEALERYFQENIDLYSTGEQRRFAHILIEAEEESVEAAEVEANEIYERILNGEDFSQLAIDHSDDIGSSELGGDLGFNEPGTFFDEFEVVAYNLDLNQVSKPVKTSVGYHIIKVLEIEEAVIPSLADVRLEVEQAYRYAETEEEFVSLSTELAELLFESDLEVISNDLGLEIQKTAAIGRTSTTFPMSESQVQAAAFSTDVLIDGNNSDRVDLSEDHHLGFRVAEHNPSLARPLTEVQEDIRYIIQSQRARDLASSRAEEILTAVKSGSLAQFVADQYGMEWTVVPGAARSQPEVDPQILREAFKLPRPAEDKESLGTTVLLNGDSVVMRVSAVHASEEGEVPAGQLAAIQGGFARQGGQVDFQEFESSLQQAASIDGIRSDD